MQYRPSPLYKLQIQYGNTMDYIVAWIPAEFSITINSEWEAIFANTVEEGLEASARNTKYAGLAKGASAIVGTVPRFQAQTAQQWMGNSPVELDIPLKLRAITDAKNDVSAIMKKLFEITLPDTTVEQVFIAPSSSISRFGAFTGLSQDRRVSVHIGKFISIPDVVITRVDNTIHSMYAKDGHPISIDCTVSFRTFVVPSVTMVQSWFRGLG